MRELFIKYFGRIYGVMEAPYEVKGSVYEEPDAFLIQCTDVDGEQNGSFEMIREVIPMEKSQDFVVKMTPKN